VEPSIPAKELRHTRGYADWAEMVGLAPEALVEVPETMSAADLMALELPEVKWAVPKVLPEGVTILAGKPKMGKSWLGLGLCVSVASGGRALGKLPVQSGTALYLGLEDNKRRLQRRLKKILDGRPAPTKLEVHWEWNRFDDGGITQLDRWLHDHPDTRLVVIDTLKKVRPRDNGRRRIYDLDYESLEPLLGVAAKHGVAIVVVHHLRKLESGDALDMISGSTGLTGGVDGALVLKRDRGKQDAMLLVDGRDIEEPTELALQWAGDVASWVLMGDAEEYRMSEERRQIVDLLNRVGEPMGPKDIASALDRSYGAIRVLLGEMFKQGTIYKPRDGVYTTLHTTANTTNSVNTANSQTERVSVSVVRSAANNSYAQSRIGKQNASDVSDVSGVNERLWRERMADFESDDDVVF
jgi:AAA domain